MGLAFLGVKTNIFLKTPSETRKQLNYSKLYLNRVNQYVDLC